MQSKCTEVSSVVNYTDFVSRRSGVTRKMSSYGWSGITNGRETTLKFCGIKFIINCFSLSHIIWWVFLSEALFSWGKILALATVPFSFIFGIYCLIID